LSELADLPQNPRALQCSKTRKHKAGWVWRQANTRWHKGKTSQMTRELVLHWKACVLVGCSTRPWEEGRKETKPHDIDATHAHQRGLPSHRSVLQPAPVEKYVNSHFHAVGVLLRLSLHFHFPEEISRDRRNQPMMIIPAIRIARLERKKTGGTLVDRNVDGSAGFLHKNRTWCRLVNRWKNDHYKEKTGRGSSWEPFE
jgi:hypothetical protein